MLYALVPNTSGAYLHEYICEVELLTKFIMNETATLTLRTEVIKVLLAEDHNIVRNGIRILLEKEQFHVVAEASNGREALQQIMLGSEAEVILADMNMPEMNGLELVKKVKELNPEKKVIIISMLDNEHYVLEAFRSGAEGYLLKNIGNEEMVFALKHVAGGGKYVCSEIMVKLLEKNINHVSVEPAPRTDVSLSKREMEVLVLIAEGLTNNEIANKLFTSRRTVEGHRKNLIEKVGARNTATLIKYAIQQGLVK